MAKDETETSVISVTGGHAMLKDQMRDYQFRGEPLGSLNLYEFLVNTYEVPTSPSDNQSQDDDQPKRGRPRKERFAYLPESGFVNKTRVQRDGGHETILRFVGRWIPRNNDPSGNNEWYAAIILLLLRPWRVLNELCDGQFTLQQTLSTFLLTASRSQKELLENLQYYHNCWDSAQRRRDALRAGESSRLFDYEQEGSTAIYDTFDDDDLDGRPLGLNENSVKTWGDSQNEEPLLDMRGQRWDECDVRFATEAMLLARAANVFWGECTRPTNLASYHVRRATQDDMAVFDAWEATLRDLTRSQRAAEGHENLGRIQEYLYQPPVEPNIHQETSMAHDNDTKEHPNSSQNFQEAHSRPILATLNKDQKFAHDIIEGRLFGGK